MELNTDFSRRVAVRTTALPWRQSPMPGVARRMLDRIGGEIARATTIVRYDPGSAFSAHTHDGGEEFLVLEGVFQDEYGDYPAGWYVRNPPTSRHVPRSMPGCVIFVKLWQFDPNDRQPVRLDTNSAPAVADPANSGVSRTVLFSDSNETVSRERWCAGATVAFTAPAGAEILVLAGSFVEAGETFERYDWLRLPPGCSTTFRSGVDGADLWIKSGHLRRIARPPGS